MDRVRNNEPSTSHQLEVQRHQEHERAVGQEEKRNILDKFHELIVDFDKATSAVQSIHNQCLVDTGYPEIQKGLLGNVVTEVGIIQSTTKSFSTNYEQFRVVVNDSSHVDEQAKETCLKHALIMHNYLKTDTIQKISHNLLNFIADYHYKDIEPIAQDAKTLHGEMNEYKKEHERLLMQLAVPATTGENAIISLGEPFP